MNEFLQLLTNASINLPLLEVSLLIIILSVCLVFRLTRFGLIAAYLFLYRWGLIFFLKQEHGFLLSYLVFGFIIGIATIVGMVWKPSAE